MRAEVTVSDSGESHQAPPEAVEERPGTLGVVLLSEVNQAGNIKIELLWANISLGNLGRMICLKSSINNRIAAESFGNGTFGVGSK